MIKNGPSLGFNEQITNGKVIQEERYPQIR